MASESFTLQQKILHRVMLGACGQDSPGLMDGMAGTAATLYMAGRKLGTAACTNLADKLVDRIVGSIRKGMPHCFYNGLCGIGWCMDFLLHEGFVSGDPSEVCADIDKAVMQVNPLRLDDSLEFGFKGLLHYVLAGMTLCRGAAFDKDFLEMVRQKAIMAQAATTDDELKSLCRDYCLSYESKEWNYQFNIESFISDTLPRVTEQNYRQQDLSLANGLCGVLIKMMYGE